MKNRITRGPLFISAVAALMIYSARDIAAQNSPASTTGAGADQSASANPAGAVQLSYGVPDVLKLTQAKVSDDTIVAFIGNSGTIYSLSASEIVYLRQEGVSDHVITAMLDQRKRVTQTAARTAAQPNYSGAYAAQTAPTYVQTATAYVPPSTVYVMPYPSVTYADYGYQPYYGGYGWYPFPALSFSFLFGHGFHGGFHNGGFSHFGRR